MGWKPKSVHVVSFSPVSRVTYHNLWRWQLVEHPAGAERTGSTRLQLCDLLALLPFVLLRFHLGMGDRFVRMGNGFLRMLQRFFGMRIARPLDGLLDVMDRFFRMRDSFLGVFNHLLGMTLSLSCQQDCRLEA